MGVHNEHVARVLKNGRVAVGQDLRPRQCCINAVGDLLDLKEICARARRLGPRPCRTQKGFLDNRCPGERASKGPAEKIAARMRMNVCVHSCLLLHQAIELRLYRIARDESTVE
jgi:hypothetical protein